MHVEVNTVYLLRNEKKIGCLYFSFDAHSKMKKSLMGFFPRPGNDDVVRSIITFNLNDI